MSKLQLQERAYEAGGVSYEESLEATERLEPSVYERLGKDGLLKLATLFYDRVFSDEEAPWFLNIFSSSTRAEAIENQYHFLVQIFGGPPLYRERKGKFTRLAGRHANYNIGPRAVERWMFHMKAALKDHEGVDDVVEQALVKYFTYTGHYIVVASEYMRSDQLSGGTQIDSGRIW